MKFTLEFDLPEGLEDDEKIYGEWAFAARQISEKTAAGHRSGVLRDRRGNEYGRWSTA